MFDNHFILFKTKYNKHNKYLFNQCLALFQITIEITHHLYYLFRSEIANQSTTNGIYSVCMKMIARKSNTNQLILQSQQFQISKYAAMLRCSGAKIGLENGIV